MYNQLRPIDYLVNPDNALGQETELRPTALASRYAVFRAGIEAGLLMALQPPSSRRKPRDPSSPGAPPANWRCSGGRRAASNGRRPIVSGEQAVADAAVLLSPLRVFLPINN